jgi:hypothetical protein
MDDNRLRIVRKIRKCLAFAADTRGDQTMRETAWRQALALIERHGVRPDEQVTAPRVATPQDWRRHTVAEAMQAGVRSTVLCSDGWYVPGN